MKPHASIPGVFCQAEEDTEFINRVLKPYHLYGCGSVKRLQEWFLSIDHPMFELLTPAKMNTNAISFLNGYLNLETLKFELWANVTQPPMTDHYFEKTLEIATDMNASAWALHCGMDGPTPLWDSLLETQLGGISRCYLCRKSAAFSATGVEAEDQFLFCAHCAHIAPGLIDIKPAPLSMCDMLEVLIGRLFYPIGKYDNWQVIFI